MLPKAKPQLPPKQGRGYPYKYLLFMAVADTAVIDTIIDLQDNNTTDIANTTIYL